MTRRPPHLPPDPDDEGNDCYHTLSLSSIPDEGGRFAREEPNNIGQTNRYPEVAASSLTRPTPEQGYAPDRDSMGEETSMQFGANLNFLPGTPGWSSPSPLEPPPANSIPNAFGEQIERGGGSSFHPNIKKVGSKFLAYVGLGLTRENVGSYDTFGEALMAVEQAEKERPR